MAKERPRFIRLFYFCVYHANSDLNFAFIGFIFMYLGYFKFHHWILPLSSMFFLQYKWVLFGHKIFLSFLNGLHCCTLCRVTQESSP
jgi:hypothetical protein